jgi:hypothetical protein
VAELSAVQNLVASWWFDYDRAACDVFGDYFTADARFTCRSDSGATAFEEFATADVSGHDALVAWQVEHRRSSPFPLRHNATNVHLVSPDEFRSYLFVTQIVGGAVSNLSSGTCTGRVAEEGARLRFAELHVVLDFTDSQVFSSR